MRKYIVLIMGCLLFTTTAFAQNSGNKKRQKRTLQGEVADFVTHHPIPGTFVELLHSDSTVIDTMRATGFSQVGNEIIKWSKWSFELPEKGIYILRFSHPNYKTTYLNVTVTFSKREWWKEIPTVYLKEDKVYQLKEVTVTATKVKFYNRGDTIVYNADAFQLSEGSMLDALIKQLPGTELKLDGRIYVNGKFVESLLLNGMDFFKGNNQIMLDNLPSYMVKNIRVYEKTNNLSEFIKKGIGGKQLVMDVNLKKQYSIGWIANTEGGAGSKNRYLGRLFAMRFTDHSQLSFYCNMNNLNDTRKPGQNDNWSPSDLSGGLTETKMGGVNYSVNDRNKRYKFNGNTQFKYTDNDNLSNVNKVNFLTNGDTYDRIKSFTRSYNTQMSTEQNFYFDLKSFNLSLQPNFSYRKYDNRNNYQSATFSDDLSHFGKEQLDSIYTPNIGSILRKIAINRNLQNSKTKGCELNTSLSISSTIKMRHSSDYLQLETSASYKNTDEDMYSHYRIDYFSNGTSETDFRNQYYKNHPDQGYNYSVKVRYGWIPKQSFCINFYYQYNQKYESSDRSLYRLDKLDGWNNDTNYALGLLPSIELMAATRDANNSYDTRHHDYSHAIGTSLVWDKYTSKYHWWAQMDMPLTFLIQKMRYYRAALDTAITRRSTLIGLNNTFIKLETIDRRKSAFFSYDVQSSTPEMTYLVNVLDNTDPLNITLGNPNLKNTYVHKWSLTLRKANQQKQRLLNIQFRYDLIQNALVMGYVYDKTSGIRTVKPDNVNGNWDENIAIYYRTSLDKKNFLTFNTTTNANYVQNVDLVSTEGATASQRSTVKTLYLTETLNSNYKIKNLQLGLKASGTWTRATSRQNDFSTIDASDYNYGVTVLLNLPWKFQLNTDLTMYSRRGYDNKSMNTNDLVWNARLSKSVLHGNLLLMFDGFDILGNLNNVTHILNAQARTEVYTNVIPRYAMFHVIYRLDIQPKKK